MIRANWKKRTTPTASDPLAVARIAGVFGIRGELKCDATSAGRMLFVPAASFVAELVDGKHESVELRSVREHKGRLIVALHGVSSIDEAQRFAGATFYAPAAEIALADNEYLDRDLVGCEVVDPSGVALGVVERVEHYPSSDMLVVGGRLVPMVKAFIRSVDTRGKRVVADLPRGLLSDD